MHGTQSNGSPLTDAQYSLSTLPGKSITKLLNFGNFSPKSGKGPYMLLNI